MLVESLRFAEIDGYNICSLFKVYFILPAVSRDIDTFLSPLFNSTVFILIFL